MTKKSANYLLFENIYGTGPLFKNQADLIEYLLNYEKSLFNYQSFDDNYKQKARNRLKAYISQLLSTTTRRSITKEFEISLKNIINAKLNGVDNSEKLAGDILTAIQDLNRKDDSEDFQKKESVLFEEFYEDIINSKYISVFTARELRFKFLDNSADSIVSILATNIFTSFVESKNLPDKLFRFNFPLLQICISFWIGLRKELIRYLKRNEKVLGQILAVMNLYGNSLTNSTEEKNINIEEKVASDILNFLSKNRIISVFHLSAPLYLTPTVVTDPTDRFLLKPYLFLESFGEEKLHLLSREDSLIWKAFVWDNIKINKLGKIVEFSSITNIK